MNGGGAPGSNSEPDCRALLCSMQNSYYFGGGGLGNIEGGPERWAHQALNPMRASLCVGLILFALVGASKSQDLYSFSLVRREGDR